MSPESEEEPVPVMQEIVDNIWFLFLVSGVIILVSYIIWGLIDEAGARVHIREQVPIGRPHG